LDNICDSARHVAVGDGDVLYARWVYSHPAGPRDSSGVDPRDSRPVPGLDNTFDKAR